MTLDTFRKLTTELPGNTPVVVSIGDHTWSTDLGLCVCEMVDERYGYFGEFAAHDPHGPLKTVVAIG